MVGRSVRWGLFGAVTVLMSVPGAFVVIVLAALGSGPPAWQAAVGVVAIHLVFAGLVWFYYTDALIVGDYLDRLARAPRSAIRPPKARSSLARLLCAAIARLDRGWRGEYWRMAADLEANAVLVEALNDPLLVLDADRRVTRANPEARALYGDGVEGVDLAERVRHPEVLEAVDAVLEHGGARVVSFTQPVPIERVFEARVQGFAETLAARLELLRAAEESPPADGSDDLVADDRPRRFAALLTLHDITAIKRSERMRNDFVANASHELRTPLATLIGFIETLRGPAREDPEARDRFLAIMDEQASRMSRLVNELLSLSRIEMVEHTPPTDPVDLGRLIAGVAASLELKARARGNWFEVDAKVDALPWVVGDADQLTQVLQNLLDNAIAYGRPDTPVRVRGEVVRQAGQAGDVRVSVIDQGVGIAKQDLPRLTERFYRADPARSRALGGTGLGLAIVKHIVSRHRGRLTIESEPGRGSTFTVQLPVGQPPATAPPRSGGAPRREASAPTSGVVVAHPRRSGHRRASVSAPAPQGRGPALGAPLEPAPLGPSAADRRSTVPPTVIDVARGRPASGDDVDPPPRHADARRHRDATDR